MGAPKGWHREDIKAAIRKRGMTLKQLALQADLQSSACRFALLHPHADGEEAISSFLGVSPAKLWPQRYDAKGNRLRPQPQGYDNRGSAFDARSKARAA